MSNINYLTRKNALVFKVTGLTLIPENQIKDITPVKLDVWESQELSNFDMLASDTCTYCAAYNYGKDSSCENCPMSIAGNECAATDSSDTWSKANDAWTDKATEEDHQALKDLALEYNKQFKEDS